MRFLPPIVRNEEVWCQLFSEPGAGSDLASLATRAERDGDDWVVTGQKVWTTWAHLADFGVLLARTDPDVPKRQGITYFLLDLHQPGVDVRPLRHITGEVDFNEVFLDGARGPRRAARRRGRRRMEGRQRDALRRTADGVGRGIGRRRPHRRARCRTRDRARARAQGVASDPIVRQELMRVVLGGAHPRLDEPTRARRREGGPFAGPGELGRQGAPGGLNQRIQLARGRRARRSGAGLGAATRAALPSEVRGMLRSRANTIEGGTTEVNKNILGERVLGLPREPDPYQARPWREIPRN